ncbi:MAG: hypothetical protein LC657_06540 [Desulfobacteraceae bacterium]|nr:hypothetical protein [Desulfobacteraceae bacterium]
MLELPIIDDVAIHVKDFLPVVRDLNRLMHRLHHDICIFGHIGFGSLHARPLFDPEDILNPNTLFNTAPITAHMDLDV